MLYMCVGTVDSISVELRSLLSTIQFLVTYSMQNGEEGLGAHVNEVKRQGEGWGEGVDQKNDLEAVVTIQVLKF